MKANQQYEQGFKEVKTAYSSLFNKKVTGEEATKRQQDYSKQALDQMKAIAATDLSDPKNVQIADDILAPFYEDKLYLQNIAMTSHYQNEFAKQEEMKNSKDKDQRALYNPTIDFYLNQGVEQLANAPLDQEAYNKLEKRKSIGIVNIGELAKKQISDAGYIKTVDANGNEMTITTNGPKSLEAYSSVYKSIAARPEYAEQNRVLSIARMEMQMKQMKDNNPNMTNIQLKEKFANEAVTGNVQWYARNIADYRKTALDYRRKNLAYLDLDPNGYPKDNKQQPRTVEEEQTILYNLRQADHFEQLARNTEENFTKEFGYVQTDATRYSTSVDDYIKQVDPNSSIYKNRVEDINTNTRDYIQNLYLSHDADAFAKGLANISSVEIKANPVQKQVNDQVAEIFKQQMAIVKQQTSTELKEEEIALKALKLKKELGLPLTQEDYNTVYGKGFATKGIGTSTATTDAGLLSGTINMPGTNIKKVVNYETYNTEKLKLALDINRNSFGSEGLLNIASDDVLAEGLTGPEILTLAGTYTESLETGKLDEESLAVREKLANILNKYKSDKDKSYTAESSANDIRVGLSDMIVADAADPLFKTVNPEKQSIIIEMAMKNQAVQKNSKELLNLTDEYNRNLKSFLDKDTTGEYKRLINSKTNDFYKPIEISEIFQLPTISINKYGDREDKVLNGDELAKLWNDKNFHIDRGAGTVTINRETYRINNINGFEYVNQPSTFPRTATVRTPYHAALDLDNLLHGAAPHNYLGDEGIFLPYPSQLKPKLNNGSSFYDVFGEPGDYSKKLNKVAEKVVANLPQFNTGLSSPELTFDLSGTGKDVNEEQKTAGTNIIKAIQSPINRRKMYTVGTDNKEIEKGISEDIEAAITDANFKDFIYDIAGSVSYVPIGPNGVPAVRINTQIGKGDKDNETIGKVKIGNIKDLRVIYMDIADSAQSEILKQLPRPEVLYRYGSLLKSKDAIKQDDFEEKNGFRYTIQPDPTSKDEKGNFTKVSIFTSEWELDKDGNYVIENGARRFTPMAKQTLPMGPGGYSPDHIYEGMKNGWILNRMEIRRQLMEYNKNRPSTAGTKTAGELYASFK